MSLLDKIFKLGEAPEAKVNEEGFYAIGKHKISGEKVKEWSDMLRAGVCPPELNVCEFYEWRDNIRVTSDIPKRPLNDTHTIEYEAIPIARFEDDKWQLYTPSLIEGLQQRKFRQFMAREQLPLKKKCKTWQKKWIHLMH